MRRAASGTRRRSIATTPLLLVLAAVGCAAAGCGARAADAPGDGAAAPSTPRATQRVRVARVELGRIERAAAVAGLTEAFRQATVSAEIGARVRERHVEPGETVAAGDPLVTLDTTQLEIAVDEAAATRAAREVDLREAERELARGDELAREGAISEGRHDALRFGRDRARSARDLADAALRRARQHLADAVVRAPFDGSVETIRVQVGDYTSPGAPVATLVDFAQVRVRAGLTADEVAELHVGDPAEISIAALGGFRAEAAVHSIGMQADANGTYPLELWLDNPERAIRGGMVADVRIVSSREEEVVVAPRAAVLRRGGRLSVFVLEGEGAELRARLRPVRVGRQQGDEVELIEGVPAGARVVIDGLFALTDGAAVRIDGAVVARGDTAWND